MTRKKETNLAISAEENTQVQDLLAYYHQIADTLHASTDQQQAEDALATITSLPETSQLALLKALSKEQHTDAADLLLALNTLANNKQVRKEARRSLIRLEGTKIYPTWDPPVTRTAAIQLPVANPPRFWKGYVTACREEGEIQLILCWEHGFEYNEVRMMILLLDFWEQGLKEFILDNTNKRNVDAQIQKIRSQLPDVTMAECTLAEARRFIEEALAVNAWRGTQPHKEYRHHLPTVKQLILDAKDVGEDRGLTFINPKLEPDELVATWVAGWCLGDYDLAYDLLANNSSLRDGLEREEWITQRRQWSNEAHPTRFEFGFIHEREPNTSSTLWLPSTFGGRNLSSRKELEMAWSLELSDTPLSGTLPEMPMGTGVYKETGRHWFWTSYTVVQEHEGWRIQNMTDEGAKAQGLPIAELQKRIKESDDRMNELMQQYTPGTPEAKTVSEEIIWRIIQTLHYDDALIVQLPLDQALYGDAFNRAMGIGALERTIVYLERMARGFAQGRGAVLRQLGVTQASLSEFYQERHMHERAQRFSQLAEASLHESLNVENTIAGHAILADLLIQQQDKLDEAEAELLQAKAMVPAPKEEAMLENSLATIAIQRDQPQEALSHYQQAASLDPNFENIWFKIGITQVTLNQLQDAKASYERAIETEPHFILPYSELAAMYMNQKQPTQARETLERGLRSNPKSAHLLALLSSVYLESGDMRHAQAVLEEAERINPQLELVQAMREEINRRKKK